LMGEDGRESRAGCSRVSAVGIRTSGGGTKSAPQTGEDGRDWGRVGEEAGARAPTSSPSERGGSVTVRELMPVGLRVMGVEGRETGAVEVERTIAVGQI
jgi:hypothetical protein